MNAVVKTPYIACLFLFLAVGSLQGRTVYQSSNFKLRHKGVVRNVFTSGRTLELYGLSERYLYDIQRLRSDWFASYRESFRAALVYDHELRTGDYLQTTEYSLFTAFEPVELVNLDSRISSSKHLTWRHRFYRLFLEYDSYPLRITAGRQQVSWGTGYFWNPTDLFNPVTFAVVEPGERHGADAVNLELALGTLSQLQLVWAPARDSHKSRGVARVKTNVANYDFSVMGGWFFRDKVAGADFSGQIGGAGFRGEWLHNFAKAVEDYDQLVLGLDYRFNPSFIMTGEYLYNSGAISEFELIEFFSRAQSGSVISTSRHLAGLYADYQPHPLVHLTGYLSVDLEQGSLFLGPRFSWNFLPDTDFEAGALLSTGEGEFSLLENTFYCSVSWYF
jgi:hypothetical protein